MIAYIIQVSICWIFFYGLYHFLLRNETFHTHNRFYLLGTLVVSLFIPFFGSYEPVAEVSQIVPVEYVMDFQYQNIDIPAISAETPSESFWSWSLLWYAYYIGIALFCFRLLFGCYQIFKYYRSGRKQQEGGITFVYNKKKHLPFSFFSNIFLSESYKIKGDVDQIVKHEIVHAHELHSLDVLAVELIQIFFWWNPILVLYKRAIKETHEYIADNTVIAHYDVNIYSAMLLNHVNSRSRHALSNQFFQKQIKNRIKMMNKKKSNGILRLKYLIAVPTMLILLVFTSFTLAPRDIISITPIKGVKFQPLKIETNKTIIQPKTEFKPQINQRTFSTDIDTSKVYVSSAKSVLDIYEVGPRLSGCEEEISIIRKTKCSMKKLTDHIYSNLTFPQEAKDANKGGIVAIYFEVNTSGNLENFRIESNPGYGLGTEALRIAKTLNEFEWIPAKKNGEKVKAAYSLPVVFLTEKNKNNRFYKAVRYGTTLIATHK